MSNNDWAGGSSWTERSRFAFFGSIIIRARRRWRRVLPQHIVGLGLVDSQSGLSDAEASAARPKCSSRARDQQIRRVNHPGRRCTGSELETERRQRIPGGRIVADGAKAPDRGALEPSFRDNEIVVLVLCQDEGELGIGKRRVSIAMPQSARFCATATATALCDLGCDQ